MQSATLNWHKTYESSADDASKLQRRVQFATDILTRFGAAGGAGGTTSSSGGGGASVGSCASAGTSSNAITAMALKLAWPEKGKGMEPTPDYAPLIAKYYKGQDQSKGANCSAFVAIVMRESGADPNYHLGSTGDQEKYVRSHPEKYDLFPSFTFGDPSKEPVPKPGDIMIVNKNGGQGADGHTYIFVGNQPDENHNEASASQGSRMPNLGKAIASDSRGNYLIARLK